jgi:hypothetical protein
MTCEEFNEKVCHSDLMIMIKIAAFIGVLVFAFDLILDGILWVIR